MSVRLVSLGTALALVAALTALGGALVAACYDVPRPACGFVCGPDGACPDDYTCANDRYCHRNGAPDDLVCRTVDAALPIDAAPDAAPDAGDAAPDGPADAALADAELDAPP